MTCPHLSVQRHPVAGGQLEWCDDCSSPVEPWLASCVLCQREIWSNGGSIAWHPCDPTTRILRTAWGVLHPVDGEPVVADSGRLTHVLGTDHGDGTLTVRGGPYDGLRVLAARVAVERWADLEER